MLTYFSSKTLSPSLRSIFPLHLLHFALGSFAIPYLIACLRTILDRVANERDHFWARNRALAATLVLCAEKGRCDAITGAFRRKCGAVGKALLEFLGRRTCPEKSEDSTHGEEIAPGKYGQGCPSKRIPRVQVRRGGTCSEGVNSSIWNAIEKKNGKGVCYRAFAERLQLLVVHSIIHVRTLAKYRLIYQ